MASATLSQAPKRPVAGVPHSAAATRAHARKPEPAAVAFATADRSARRALRSPTSGSGRCVCGGTPGPDGECAACKARRLSRAGSSRGSPPATAPPIVDRALATAGNPLDTRSRAYFEPRFGADLAAVRIHDDAMGAASAHAVDADAYTVGNDIVFAAGRHAPGTVGGDRLLAHELAHVVQQQGAPTSGPIVVDWDPGSPAERAASSAAEGLAAPTTAPQPPTRTARRLQRSVGSPAGGCGVCMGPAAAGTLAHGIIEAEMTALYGGSIFAEELVPSPDDDNGRLDLMTPTATGFAIGEIKPANPAGLLQGDLDLMWYEDQIRAFGVPVERMTDPPPLMSMIFRDPLAPGCVPQALFVDPPVHGIYMYWCEPDFAELVGTCECLPPGEEEEEQGEEGAESETAETQGEQAERTEGELGEGGEVAPELEEGGELVPELVEGGEAVEEGVTIWEVLEAGALLAL